MLAPVRVVSTSSLPIDLAAQVTRAIPGAVVEVPAQGHVDLGTLDLASADALVCLLLDPIDGALFARAPKLRVVANCAVGVDNVDLAAARRAQVVVTNTPDVLTEGERLVRSGAWTGWALDQLLGTQLLGKTLGIVGFGRIGQALARRGAGFGMRVIYADPHIVSAPHERVDLDTLFATADAISLHCPLTPETRHVVDARRLALVKPGALLVNTSRGGCVDEGALVDALTAGRLGGAALDVYEQEPHVDHRLLGCPRLVLAPHIGSATTEARTQMAQLCADAVIDVLQGRRTPNVVVVPEAQP